LCLDFWIPLSADKINQTSPDAHKHCRATRMRD
jgi:hypothetical protein